MATAVGIGTKTRKSPAPRALKTASAVIETAAVEPLVAEPVVAELAPAIEPALVEPPVPESVLEADPVPLPDPAVLVEAAAETVTETVTAAATIIPEIPVSTPSIPPLSIPKVTDMAMASFSGYEELASFGKANLEAFIQANTVFVKGIEEMSKEVFGLTQSSLETAAAATTAMLSAKTLKDMVELNADFTKAQYEKLLANTTKFGEMGVKLATDTAAPLTARANHVVSTITHASV